MNGPSNGERAEWAQAGLDAFAVALGYRSLMDMVTDNTPGTPVSDVLADLMHYCDVNDLDFDTLLEMGRMHHGEELLDEQGED